MKRILYYVPLTLLLLTASCQKGDTDGINNDSVTSDYSDILIPGDQVDFYANLDDYNINTTGPATRGSNSKSKETVQLEKLIDRRGSKKTDFSGSKVTQIPFKQNEEGVRSSYQRGKVFSPDSATVVKKYLIEFKEKKNTHRYIVTMITEKGYAKSNPSFDYLESPNYEGAVLFSDLKGTLRHVNVYKDGLILNAYPVKPKDIDKEKNEKQFIMLIGSGVKTRSQEVEQMDGGPLTESICIAYKSQNDVIETSYCYGGGTGFDWNSWENYIPSAENVQSGSGGGGGGSTTSTDPVQCYVTLTCNVPQYITMEGGGSYKKGTKVRISYWQKNTVTDLKFQYWVGGFTDRETAIFSYKISESVSATAYFGSNRPCANANGAVNPLHVMQIASSTYWGNYLGGTYGYTRTQFNEKTQTYEDKFHQGIDLYASQGTPVYAMYDGDIPYNGTVSNYNDNSYHEGSFGNEIRITCTDGNKTFVCQYAHLLAGNPIANNPRTGKPFGATATKDNPEHVYAGDLIGYTGRTGNAGDVPNPHLHLGIKIGGKWVDPAPYINGKYNTKTINNTNGRITNIDCK